MGALWSGHCYRDFMPHSHEEALEALLRATNTHDFSLVAPLIAEDALYYFSDATVVGRAQVGEYFRKTWETIRDEEYWAEDIVWQGVTENLAVATYRFRWRGRIDGAVAQGSGRGTNVFVSSSRRLLATQARTPQCNVTRRSVTLQNVTQRNVTQRRALPTYDLPACRFHVRQSPYRVPVGYCGEF